MPYVLVGWLGSAPGQPLGRVDRLALIADFEVEARSVLTATVADQRHRFTLLDILADMTQ